jgi:hypothetical protein
MKSFTAVFILSFVILFSARAQTKAVYDSVLANKLGGNANGMKNYVLVI